MPPLPPALVTKQSFSVPNAAKASSLAARTVLETSAIPQFIPRPTFEVTTNIKRAYYLGHHRSTLRQLSALRSNTDFYIDVRDYRVPLSSANPLLERALTGLPRIIVYTKRDLGVPSAVHDAGHPETNHVPKKTERILRELHARSGVKSEIFFISATNPSSKVAMELHTAIHEMTVASAPHRDLSVRPATGLLVGMPNVGKSTLLNALRSTSRLVPSQTSSQSTMSDADAEATPESELEDYRSKSKREKKLKNTKVAKTGDTPGVTRSVSERTHITAYNPSAEDENSVGAARIYARDTPGVFLPYITSPEEMLKLALTACVSSTVVPLVILADYLLFWMNLISPRLYTSSSISLSRGKKPSGKGMVLCPTPTNDVHFFLQQTAIRLGKLKRHGVPDEEGAAEWLLRRYREGKLGKFILDDVSDAKIVEDYMGKEERSGVWWSESDVNADNKKR